MWISSRLFEAQNLFWSYLENMQQFYFDAIIYLVICSSSNPLIIEHGIWSHMGWIAHINKIKIKLMLFKKKIIIKNKVCLHMQIILGPLLHPGHILLCILFWFTNVWVWLCALAMLGMCHLPTLLPQAKSPPPVACYESVPETDTLSKYPHLRSLYLTTSMMYVCICSKCSSEHEDHNCVLIYLLPDGTQL